MSPLRIHNSCKRKDFNLHYSAQISFNLKLYFDQYGEDLAMAATPIIFIFVQLLHVASKILQVKTE